jgi:hypothetical protein
MKLTPAQQRVWDEIQHQIKVNGGWARWHLIDWRASTICALERAGLIEVCGDEITLPGEPAQLDSPSEQ